jgi:hypothetical protein
VPCEKDFDDVDDVRRWLVGICEGGAAQARPLWALQSIAASTWVEDNARGTTRSEETDRSDRTTILATDGAWIRLRTSEVGDFKASFAVTVEAV